jgi:large-conductance mechanosensitive channel
MKIKRKKSMAEEIRTTFGENGSVKVLELGKIMYSFAKRLDPLVAVTKEVHKILSWKRPEVTMAYGLLLSLVVLFPKISTIIFSLCLIFGKGYFINQLERSVSRVAIT